MMYTGMLWFDNDAKAELKLRVERAAEYYRRKYGQQPNLCFVHPSMLANRELPLPEPAVMRWQHKCWQCRGARDENCPTEPFLDRCQPGRVRLTTRVCRATSPSIWLVLMASSTSSRRR